MKGALVPMFTIMWNSNNNNDDNDNDKNNNNKRILLIIMLTIKILFTINSLGKKPFRQNTIYNSFRLKKTLSFD